MAMNGERIPATRVYGGKNNCRGGVWVGWSVKPRKRRFAGGCHTGFGTLGPRRERANRAAKATANTQRRQDGLAAIQRQLSTLVAV